MDRNRSSTWRPLSPGVAGVEAEVEEDGVELARVTEHGGQLCGCVEMDGDRDLAGLVAGA
jgi:hypothetical protein